MRVGVIHSFYSSRLPSGENRVVVDQVEALREAGHDVALFARHTDLLDSGLRYSIRTAARVATGRGVSPLDAMKRFDPDVVHIHNTFPNVASSWIPKWSGPIVVTLHNFRLLCSNGLLFRDGAPCCECIDHGDWRAVVHGCYRDSRIASLPVALGRPVSRKHILSRAAAVITTSEAFDQRFRELTENAVKTTLIPNFGVGLPELPLPAADRRAWLALGRFSPEKGFVELIRDWPQDQALVLMGEGPERGVLESLIQGKSIEMRSPVPILELRQLLRSFRGVVFPSQWLEAAPQVVVEAARVGIPVITHANNGSADLVLNSGAGSVYSDGPSLVRALATANENLDSMGRAAHQLFIDRWSVAKWIRDVQRLYRGLVNESAHDSAHDDLI